MTGTLSIFNILKCVSTWFKCIKSIDGACPGLVKCVDSSCCYFIVYTCIDFLTNRTVAAPALPMKERNLMRSAVQHCEQTLKPLVRKYYNICFGNLIKEEEILPHTNNSSLRNTKDQLRGMVSIKCFSCDTSHPKCFTESREGESFTPHWLVVALG